MDVPLIMDDKQTYYAVIPASVRYDEKLSANAKLLYAEITCLTNKNGECFASNNYFANLYHVTKQAISRWLLLLQKQNYINIEYFYKPNSKEIEKRLIKLNVSINIDTCQQKVLRCQQKVKDNNNNNITKSNIIYNVEIVKEIIDYLNLVTKSKYKYTTSSTKRLIHARLNEGFSVDDFKRVIDIKNAQWSKDNKMKEYLRPETLFGSKFESYLNQKNNTVNMTNTTISGTKLQDITMAVLNENGQ